MAQLHVYRLPQTVARLQQHVPSNFCASGHIGMARGIPMLLPSAQLLRSVLQQAQLIDVDHHVASPKSDAPDCVFFAWHDVSV
jgi:hypothetical protein